MTPITTIVHFDVPVDNVERFLAFWQGTVKDEMTKQPGLIDGIFYRGIDPGGPFQLINVGRWESAEALESGLRALDDVLQRDGVKLANVFQEWNIHVSQNNYVEEVPYTATPAPSQTS